jgi:hypothetical protein
MFRPVKGHHQVLSIEVIYSYTMNNSITDQLQYINKNQIINTKMLQNGGYNYVDKTVLQLLKYCKQSSGLDPLSDEICSDVFMILYIIRVGT